jgi:hypothetical protein
VPTGVFAVVEIVAEVVGDPGTVTALAALQDGAPVGDGDTAQVNVTVPVYPSLWKAAADSVGAGLTLWL